MATSNFPNGYSQHGTASHTGITSITGAGTITTNLDTIAGVLTSFGTALGTATNQVFTCQGTALANAAGAATFVARAYTGTGLAGTVAAPVVWTAYGTRS